MEQTPEKTPEKSGSGGWGLDAMAAKLQAKADVILRSSSSTNEDGTPATGGKREALLNVANIVKEQAGKGLDSSKEYLTKVVEKVSAYASDASTNASAQYKTTSETANTHFTAAKEAANTHLAGLQTNLNRAIAEGQTQATSTNTESGTTERGLTTEEEPLKFPFSLISWFVSLCHGKGTPEPATTAESTTSTSKDFSIESLQNAAATLTENLGQGAHERAGSGVVPTKEEAPSAA